MVIINTNLQHFHLNYLGQEMKIYRLCSINIKITMNKILFVIIRMFFTFCTTFNLLYFLFLTVVHSEILFLIYSVRILVSFLQKSKEQLESRTHFLQFWCGSKSSARSVLLCGVWLCSNNPGFLFMGDFERNHRVGPKLGGFLL